MNRPYKTEAGRGERHGEKGEATSPGGTSPGGKARGKRQEAEGRRQGGSQEGAEGRATLTVFAGAKPDLRRGGSTILDVTLFVTAGCYLRGAVRVFNAGNER